MQVLANVFEDMGYETGLNFPAMAKLADYYRSIQPHYQFAEPNMVRAAILDRISGSYECSATVSRAHIKYMAYYMWEVREGAGA